MDYLVSQAFYMPPSAFRTRSQLGGDLSWAVPRVQPLGSVASPAAKVAVYETNVWHALPKDANPLVDTGPLSYHATPGRSSAAFVDGHAESVDARLAVPAVSLAPINPEETFGTTKDGVAGRDWPGSR